MCNIYMYMYVYMYMYIFVQWLVSVNKNIFLLENIDEITKENMRQLAFLFPRDHLLQAAILEVTQLDSYHSVSNWNFMLHPFYAPSALSFRLPLVLESL